MTTPVVMVRTGTANLASVAAAFGRLSVEVTFSDNARLIESAPFVVLPGVGAFGAAMAQLQERKLVEVLRARILAGKPTLAICLGLQIFAAGSEESPGVPGLGIFPSIVRRYGATVRVPQFGWNQVQASEGCETLGDGFAYFANSYFLPEVPSEFSAATAFYEKNFIAAFERGPVVACQFHPELSGQWGLDLLQRWLAVANPPQRLALKNFSGSIGRRDSENFSMPTAAGGWQPTRSWQTVRIIPCLDCDNGRVVKGVRFSSLRDMGDPAELAARYEQEGADELVLLDISATAEARAHQITTVEAVRRRLSIPLTVGGGVRSIDDAGRLLNAGADKVAVNTAAVERPEILTEIAERFGKQCAVLALDAKATSNGQWEVVTHAGKKSTGKDAIAWAKAASALGAGEILLTSFDRDGTREGYDLPLLTAMRQAVSVPIIASGGASHVEHLREAIEAGADAVLAASIFHEQQFQISTVKAELAKAGIAVRQ